MNKKTSQRTDVIRVITMHDAEHEGNVVGRDGTGWDGWCTEVEWSTLIRRNAEVIRETA